jgi:hypothetical protein
VFLDNVRHVNNALAPGCFCAHSYKYRTPGVPSMRIYGQTYHTINEQLENQLDDEGDAIYLLGITIRYITTILLSVFTYLCLCITLTFSNPWPALHDRHPVRQGAYHE